jgi:hypothetical protein
MNSRWLALILAALCWVPRVASAEPQSPEAVAGAAAEFAKQGDWPAYARSMHPDALAGAKRLFRPLVARDASGRVGKTFFGVSSVKQYDAMSDSTTFQALMENLTMNLPAFGEAMRTADFKIIGTVPEGDDLVHVVYKADARVDDLAISRTSVMSLRKYQGEWRLLLAGNIEGLAGRLSQLSGTSRR